MVLMSTGRTAVTMPTSAVHGGHWSTAFMQQLQLRRSSGRLCKKRWVRLFHVEDGTATVETTDWCTFVDRAGARITLGSRGCAALSRASRTQHAKQRVGHVLNVLSAFYTTYT